MIVPSFPAGTATSIGSLPHADPAAAVAFVLDRLPGLPAAPSLPCRSPLESMVAQAAWGIVGVDVGADGSLVVDPGRLDPAAPLGDPTLAGEPFVALRAFLDAVTNRNGPIKLQLTGPVTLALALHRAGAPLELALDVAGAAVRNRASALLDLAERGAPAAGWLVFVDEPGLASAALAIAAPPVDRVLDLVSGALAALEPRAVTGLHCCGHADWRALIQAGPQVLSLPVDAGIDGAAGALGAFVDRGGWVAWGTVPTEGPVGTDAGRWWRRLSALWCDLVRAGCDPVRLRQQALITPVCGLALHGTTQAELICDLTTQVADRLADQTLGVRLSVGA
ncbi:hypothetical protein BH20ACT2_BH20ACT2_24860 [soil metagenome]